jgi:hypothetical protein
LYPKQCPDKSGPNNVKPVSDFSSYAPELPHTLLVHKRFGEDRQFYVEGYIPEVSAPENPPLFKLIDINGIVLYQLKINVDAQTITGSSELKDVCSIIC